MAGSGEDWRSERRARLLEAAGRVFARQTYGQASMDDIAHEAGVGKPTLYRYFPSKEALFVAVFARALDELEEKLERVLAAPGGVAARLPALIAAMVPTVRDHLVALRYLGEEAALVDQSKRRVFRERRTRIARYLERAIEDGIGRGEVRPVAAARTANFVIGMIWSGSAVTRPEDDGALVDEISSLVLRGVLAPVAGAPAATRRQADETMAPPWRRHVQDVPGSEGRDGARSPAAHAPTTRSREVTS